MYVLNLSQCPCEVFIRADCVSNAGIPSSLSWILWVRVALRPSFSSFFFSLGSSPLQADKFTLREGQSFTAFVMGFAASKVVFFRFGALPSDHGLPQLADEHLIHSMFIACFLGFHRVKPCPQVSSGLLPSLARPSVSKLIRAMEHMELTRERSERSERSRSPPWLGFGN